MTNIEIGNRIKYARELRETTLDDIARKVGVAKSTVQRYENGKIQNIKLPVVESIAYALNVNPAWIIGKSEEFDIIQNDTPKIMQYYLQLNDIGREEAEKRVYELTQLSMYIESHNDEESTYQSHKRVLNYYEKISQSKESIPIAAHERTDIDIPSGVDTSDNDIMDDNNF